MNVPDNKVIAALYIKGIELIPDDVTAALGVQPTRSQLCGESRTTSAGSKFFTKTGLWALVVERESSDVTAVLADLLKTLGQQPGLTTVPNAEEAYFDIFVAASADEDGDGICEFELPSAQILALAKYGIPVRFSINMGKQ